MQKRETYHVTFKEEKRKVQKEGARRPTKNFENKHEAVDFGREIAKNQSLGQLIIHKKNGIIGEERTIGNISIVKKIVLGELYG